MDITIKVSKLTRRDILRTGGALKVQLAQRHAQANQTTDHLPIIRLVQTKALGIRGAAEEAVKVSNNSTSLTPLWMMIEGAKNASLNLSNETLMEVIQDDNVTLEKPVKDPSQ
jgi:hypothetical protein